MNNEIWKDIIWYEWLYQVSNFGRIKTLARKKWFVYWKERIKNIQHHTNWYAFTTLSKNWINKWHRIHRLVAQAFISNPENKPCINHIDWNKDNNTIENLEWCTYSENWFHKYRVLKCKPNRALLWRKWVLNHFSVKVNQYTLDWVFIKTRDSIADVRRFYWKPYLDISKVCSWKAKKTWWFIWKYTEIWSI